MLKFIKSYYPILVSCLLTYIYSFFLKVSFMELEISDTKGMILAILGLLLVIIVWGEIIGFIIHAVNSKFVENKVLWVILIYMFNIFIFPYYNIKYVIKSDKISLKMIIYVLLMIGSILLGIG